MCFYGEPPSFFDSHIVKRARKAHRCTDCREDILPGESYEHIAGVWEGDFETYKVCARCYWDRSRVEQHELSVGCAPDESTPPMGQLLQALCEIRGEFMGREDPNWAERWKLSPRTYRAEREVQRDECP